MFILKMKYFRYYILLVILIIPVILLGQLRDSVHIKTDIYEIMYSEVYQQPLWIKYRVRCSDGKISRKGLNFYVNDSIVTSDDKDYDNNEYDKGHMAPASDFNCELNDLKKTFSYLNCALQQENLNRGVWKSLEEKERKYVKSDVVDIEIKLVFDKTSKTLNSGAKIPSGFYKTIKLVNSGKVYKYYFPNVKPTNKTLDYYEIKK